MQQVTGPAGGARLFQDQLAGPLAQFAGVTRLGQAAADKGGQLLPVGDHGRGVTLAQQGDHIAKMSFGVAVPQSDACDGA